MYNFYRGRRLRQSSKLRRLVRETFVQPQDLIQPYFVLETDDPETVQPIPSMPGQNQYGIKALENRIQEYQKLGLSGIILFGIPKIKDEQGSQAYADEGIIQRTVSRLKESFPDLVIITDLCLCEYTSHGHCGIVQNGYVQNDLTLDFLAKAALSQAKAGADIIAPSDMMDGRIKVIRQMLDQNGFSSIPILSYAVKYSSSFYGPFREAAGSSPSFGDRKTYQMDCANSREALREALADSSEGADMLMVKPALPYLDILSKLRQRFDQPLAAYQVSGEYSMFKAAALKGWLEEEKIVYESLTSIKRAGADIILSYFTEDFLSLVNG